MSLELRFAPSADLLREKLLENLQACWKKSPLQSPTIIVPNPAVKRWLLLRMAEDMTSVLGLQLDTLERTIWNWLQPDPGMARLQAQDLQLVIANVLDDALLSSADFAPVRSYLGTTTIDPIKRLQLAGFVARLFQEYEFNRPSVWDRDHGKWALPGLCASWLDGKPYDFTREVSELVRTQERWQRELYRKTMAHLEGFQLQSLPQLLTLRRNSPTGWRVPPGHYYMYLVSKISHWHRNLLVDISQMPGVQLHVYLTNPCAEFWEDVDTWGSKMRRQHWKSAEALRGKRHDPAGIAKRKPEDYQLDEMHADFFDSTDPKLLELWGHSARENVALWCADADWDFEYHRPTWVTDNMDITDHLSCLPALQLSLLRRESKMLAGTIADKSLQVLAAPDLGREVEELRAQILDAVQDGTVQSLEDIVVYVTDMASYLPHIHRVFGAHKPWDASHIGYNLLGAPGGGSLYAQAVQALLTLVDGRYDRAAIFTLLRNPVWQASHHIPASEVAIWESWAAATGMIRGYDKNHRAAMGDQGAAASDMHTFGLGISRLLVGDLVSGPVDLNYSLPIEGYRDFETKERTLVEHFLAVLEEIYQAIANLKMGSLADSLSAILKLVEAWIPNIPTESEWNPIAEGKVRKQFLDSMAGLQALASKTGYGIVDTRELLSWVRNCLPEELPAGSKAWIGGVTFAPLRMGMVLPHAMVCVLGLGAKEFPGESNSSVLDLLTVVRKVGDSRPVRDNQLAFLELLHAARKRLVMSWRAHNLQKEEALQPSSVLLELLDVLKAQNMEPKRELPLVIWEQLAQSATEPEHNWSPTQLAIATASKEPRAAWRFAQDANTAALRKDFIGNTVSISEVQAFFENPLQYHMGRVLGIRDEDVESALDVKDEPLHSTNLDAASLQKDLWAEMLQFAFPAQAKDAPPSDQREHLLMSWIRKRVPELYEQRQLSGSTPLPPFDKVEQEHLLQWGLARIPSIAELESAGFTDHTLLEKTDMSLGRPQMPGSLTIGNWQVKVPHVITLVPRSGRGFYGFIGFEKKASLQAAENHKLWLRGALQGLLEGKQPSELRAQGIALIVLNRQSGVNNFVKTAKLKSWDLDAWKKTENWLLDLVEQMSQGHAEHLPYVAIQKQYKALLNDKQFASNPFAALQEIDLQDLLESDSVGYTVYNDFWKLVEARLPADEQIQALAKRRYAPMLENWIHE